MQVKPGTSALLLQDCLKFFLTAYNRLYMLAYNKIMISEDINIGLPCGNF